jgi:hypothetical protein
MVVINLHEAVKSATAERMMRKKAMSAALFRDL